MTKQQEAAVAAIKSRLSSRQEWKTFEATEYSHFVVIFAERGLVGDEGTMAEIVCRDTGRFVIGTRGRIEARESNHGVKKCQLRSHPLIYGWRSFCGDRDER